MAGDGHRREGADPLLDPVFSLSGVKAPSIAYVGVASDDDRGFFKWMASSFKLAGSGPVRLAPMAATGADLEKATAILDDADLVFVTGGDVEAGMRILHERRMLPHLTRLFRAGKPFFGLSAGSIMLARAWVRWANPNDDQSAGVFDCMGFAPVLCDMHAESDDWVELRTLLKLVPGSATGYGVPGGAALCVMPDGRVAALGRPIDRYKVRAGRVTPLIPLAPL